MNFDLASEFVQESLFELDFIEQDYNPIIFLYTNCTRNIQNDLESKVFELIERDPEQPSLFILAIGFLVAKFKDVNYKFKKGFERSL
jgi:hypothetical protein